MCPCILGWTKHLVRGLMAQVCMLSLVYNAKTFGETSGSGTSGVTVAKYSLVATFWLF